MTSEIAVRDYRRVLVRPELRSTLLFSAMARLPYAMISLALLLYVQERSGSFAWAGTMSSALLLGVAVGSVAQGRCIDSISPVRPLLTACAGFTVCVIGLLIAVEKSYPGFWQIATAAGAGCTQPNVAPASRAVWGRVIKDPSDVTVGSAYEALSLDLFFVVGPGLTGVLSITPWSGLGVTFATLMMVVGTVGFCRTPVARAWPHASEPIRSARLWKALNRPGLRTLALAAAGLGVCLGGVELAIPAAVGAGLGGLLLSSCTVTSILFALPYGSRPWPRSVSVRIPTLLAGFALFIAILAIPRSVWSISILTLTAGCLIAIQATTHSIVLQHMVPENEIAEGFGWILAAMTVGASLGQLLSGLLTERCGPQMAFTGIALLGIGVAGWVMLRRSTLEAGAQDRKIIA